jgi:hypothetical protein
VPDCSDVADFNLVRPARADAARALVDDPSAASTCSKAMGRELRRQLTCLHAALTGSNVTSHESGLANRIALAP